MMSFRVRRIQECAASGASGRSGALGSAAALAGAAGVALAPWQGRGGAFAEAGAVGLGCADSGGSVLGSSAQSAWITSHRSSFDAPNSSEAYNPWVNAVSYGDDDAWRKFASSAQSRVASASVLPELSAAAMGFPKDLSSAEEVVAYLKGDDVDPKQAARVPGAVIHEMAKEVFPFFPQPSKRHPAPHPLVTRLEGCTVDLVPYPGPSQFPAYLVRVTPADGRAPSWTQLHLVAHTLRRLANKKISNRGFLLVPDLADKAVDLDMALVKLGQLARGEGTHAFLTGDVLCTQGMKDIMALFKRYKGAVDFAEGFPADWMTSAEEKLLRTAVSVFALLDEDVSFRGEMKGTLDDFFPVLNYGRLRNERANWWANYHGGRARLAGR